MATALRLTLNALEKEYTVTAGQAATLGEPAIFGASDTTVQNSNAASDLIIGTFKATAVAGAQVVVYIHAFAVIPCEVGTGGATRGTKAVAVADGYTDAAAHNSDGVNNASTYGFFMQSGTAGQTVGLALAGVANRGIT